MEVEKFSKSIKTIIENVQDVKYQNILIIKEYTFFVKLRHNHNMFRTMSNKTEINPPYIFPINKNVITKTNPIFYIIQKYTKYLKYTDEINK